MHRENSQLALIWWELVKPILRAFNHHCIVLIFMFFVCLFPFLFIVYFLLSNTAWKCINLQLFMSYDTKCVFAIRVSAIERYQEELQKSRGLVATTQMCCISLVNFCKDADFEIFDCEIWENNLTKWPLVI